MLRVVLCCVAALALLSGTAQGLFGPRSDVIMLTKKNFDKEVMNSNHVWMVEFFAPWCGHCKSLAPVWEQVAKKLKGVVKIAAVDADSEKELGGRFGVRGFPTIKAFGSPLASSKPDKKKKKSAMDYNGGRTAKAISDFATSLLPNRIVGKLADAGKADKWLADNEAVPKVLLFSDKAAVPPLFTALAVDYHEKLAFGFVRKAASAVSAKYGVSEYPSILVVPAEGEPVKYDGPLKPDKLSKWLKPFATGEGAGAADDEPEQAKEEEKPKSKPPPLVNDDGPVEVKEITSEAVVTEQCVEAKHMCLLAILDPLADAASHKRYLATLGEVADKVKRHFRVVWVDVAKQPEFAAHFDPDFLPALRVWHKGHKAVANVVGAMTPEAVHKFVKDVLAGKARTRQVGDAPAVVEGGVVYEEEPLDDFVEEAEPQQKDEL